MVSTSPTLTAPVWRDRFHRRAWGDAERGRGERLRGEVERRMLVKRWVAVQTGRAYTTLLQALHGKRAAARTLDAVEALLARIDAGEVQAVTHSGPTAVEG